MNTTKALKQTAPPEILAALGLPEGATIGSALDRALQLLGDTVKNPSGEWTAEDSDALFTRLCGTPEERAERQKMRRFGYQLCARTATREELNMLIRAGVLDEPQAVTFEVLPGTALQ